MRRGKDFDEIISGLRENDLELTDVKFLIGDFSFDESHGPVHYQSGRMESLASAVKANRNLKRLDISHVKLYDGKIGCLADALAESNSVEELSLAGNLIRDAGACLLAKMLEKNKTLKTLRLNGNLIGVFGIRALLKALEKNLTLTELTLNEVEISPVLMRQIKIYIARNRELAEKALKPENLAAEHEASESELEDLTQPLTLPEGLTQEIQAVQVTPETQQAQAAFARGEFNQAMSQVVRQFSGREAIVAYALRKSEAELITLQEQNYIMSMPVLAAYYDYCIQVKRSVLQLTRITRDPSVNHLTSDAIEKGLNIAHTVTGAAEKVVKASASVFKVKLTVPILSESLQVMANVYEFKKSREAKQEAVIIQHFFRANVNQDDFVEALARRLCLFQAPALAEIAKKSPGRFDLARNEFNALLCDDVAYKSDSEEIPLRTEAREDCARFFSVIFREIFKNPNGLENIPEIFCCMMRDKYEAKKIKGPDPEAYQSPLKNLVQDYQAQHRAMSAGPVVALQAPTDPVSQQAGAGSQLVVVQAASPIQPAAQVQADDVENLKRQQKQATRSISRMEQRSRVIQKFLEDRYGIKFDDATGAMQLMAVDTPEMRRKISYVSVHLAMLCEQMAGFNLFLAQVFSALQELEENYQQLHERVCSGKGSRQRKAREPARIEELESAADAVRARQEQLSAASQEAANAQRDLLAGATPIEGLKAEIRELAKRQEVSEERAKQQARHSEELAERYRAATLRRIEELERRAQAQEGVIAGLLVKNEALEQRSQAQDRVVAELSLRTARAEESSAASTSRWDRVEEACREQQAQIAALVRNTETVVVAQRALGVGFFDLQTRQQSSVCNRVSESCVLS